jgi:putative phosphoesterase
VDVVVMSDSHLYEVTPQFEALCERYCRSADLVIHLGDIMGSTVLDYLALFPLEAVCGNMDSLSIRRQLPAKKVIRLGGYRVGLIHGWGSAAELPESLYTEFVDVDAVLFGHTHEPLLHRSNGILWFNPGSVSSGRRGAPRSIGLLRLDTAIHADIIPL